MENQIISGPPGLNKKSYYFNYISPREIVVKSNPWMLLLLRHHLCNRETLHGIWESDQYWKGGLIRWTSGKHTLTDQTLCNLESILDLFQGEYPLYADFLVLGIISTVYSLPESVRLGTRPRDNRRRRQYRFIPKEKLGSEIGVWAWSVIMSGWRFLSLDMTSPTRHVCAAGCPRQYVFDKGTQ